MSLPRIQYIVTSLLTLFLVPTILFAQTPAVQGEPNIIPSLQILGGAELVVTALGYIAVGLATLFFFWGLAKYILNAGGGEEKDTGKKLMIRGIVALFIIAAIWGIIGFIGVTLGIREGGAPDIQNFQRSSINNSGSYQEPFIHNIKV